MFRKGFTLIELLIVVTILAILAGAAIPYFGEYIDDARIAKAKTDLSVIKDALVLYESRRGEVYTGADATILKTRGYLTSVPGDPWGSAYGVTSGTVYSRGPDGALGGGDDIIFPYQAPLAMTSAYWVDYDGDGIITPNTLLANDYIVVKFTRPLKSATGSVVGAARGIVNAATDLTFSAGGTVTAVDDVNDTTDVFDASGKSVRFTFTTVFVPGKTTVTSTANVKDGADNTCAVDTLKILAR